MSNGTLVSDEERARRILAMVLTPGTEMYPSKINHGRYVVVNGITGLDACERTIDDCFNSLINEEDGMGSPGRLAVTFDNGLPTFKMRESVDPKTLFQESGNNG